MSISSQLLQKANIIPLLQLGVKQEGGGVKSTGSHKVKFISDKIIKGKDYQTGKEREEVEYLFEEEGLKKRYSVPIKNENDELHYFVQRMAEVKEGEEIIIEMKYKGSKNYIEFRRTEELEQSPQQDDDIPIIENDEPRKIVPTESGNDVPIEEINTGL